MKNLFIAALFLLGLSFAACQRDEKISFNPQFRISVSTDSVLFDTVFTAVGSTTRRFQLFNFNANALQISSISLGGGTNSPFKVNVNGYELVGQHSLTINGSDSVNVFVRVNINPNLQNQPFVVQDSIVMICNNNRTVIPLLAYGQNAVFINNQQINADTNWESTLPYVITNRVTVAENATLTLKPGVRIFFHKDAKMLVNGTLIAKGTLADSILFTSDRRERLYQDEPGQWQGIHFSATSQHNVIEHASLKNAVVGLQVDSMSNNQTPKLTIASSTIKNMQLTGILAHHTNIAAYNSLISNCGQYLVYILNGGKYEFIQNTFAGYNFYFARRNPALSLSDSSLDGKYNSLNVSLINNIIWGSLENELLLDKKANLPLQQDIRNNLIKSTQNFAGTGNLYNTDPLFVAPRVGNFKLAENSPAFNQGVNLQSHPAYGNYLSKDLLNKSRTFPSTLGCFERN
jgi:hypothetical protein